MSQQRKSGVCAEVLLNGKASMTDAKRLALMNARDLAWLEDHLSQRDRGTWCVVARSAPLEESLGSGLTLEAQILFKPTTCLHPRA